MWSSRRLGPRPRYKPVFYSANISCLRKWYTKYLEDNTRRGKPEAWLQRVRRLLFSTRLVLVLMSFYFLNRVQIHSCARIGHYAPVIIKPYLHEFDRNKYDCQSSSSWHIVFFSSLAKEGICFGEISWMNYWSHALIWFQPSPSVLFSLDYHLSAGKNSLQVRGDCLSLVMSTSFPFSHHG